MGRPPRRSLRPHPRPARSPLTIAGAPRGIETAPTSPRRFHPALGRRARRSHQPRLDPLPRSVPRYSEQRREHGPIEVDLIAGQPPVSDEGQVHPVGLHDLRASRATEGGVPEESGAGLVAQWKYLALRRGARESDAVAFC